MNKTGYIKLNPQQMTGLAIEITGLFLLLYSFITANTFFIAQVMEGPISFTMRRAFFICMVIIGGYLTRKGAILTDTAKITEIVLTPVGFIMLGFVFMAANTSIDQEFILNESFAIQISFFFCMVGIGGYLVAKGVPFAHASNNVGVASAPLGSVLLLLSFMVANKFVSGLFVADETIVSKLIFFACMVAIGLYLTERVTLSSTFWSRIVGVVLTAIGLFILGVSFMTGNESVRMEFLLNGDFILRFSLFSLMIAIGCYLTIRGSALLKSPRITGAIFTPIGSFMLLFSFVMANEFMGGEPVAYETFIPRILFSISMIIIGAYLVGKGVSELVAFSHRTVPRTS